MNAHVKTLAAIATTLVVMACSATADDQAAVDFSAHWHDGNAELDGYNLEVSRYGQARAGHAVMIFVTEPFSESKRVKVNDHQKNPDDTFDAFKLNLVRDFQTGIYDYNTMVSMFVRSSNFEPVKLTFSSAEWCGHVFLDVRVDPGKISGYYSSYFEDESGKIELKRPKAGLTEDELFIRLRGLRGDFLAPGQSTRVDYLPGVLYTRFEHKDLEWTKARISRANGTETVTVPAGAFETIRYTVEIDGGRAGTFHIEAVYPHRIIRWSLAPDISGELTGSKRMPYWRLNGEGDESYLKEIGLGGTAR